MVKYIVYFVAIACLAISGCSAGNPNADHNRDYQGTPYSFMSSFSKMNLSLPTNVLGYSEGAAIQQLPADYVESGHWYLPWLAHDKWSVAPVSHPKTFCYRIISLLTGKCLTRGNIGDVVRQARCNPEDFGQLWTLDFIAEQGVVIPDFVIMGSQGCGQYFNLGINQCLQVNDSKEKSNIVLAKCDKSKVNQRWQRKLIPGGPNPPLDTGKGALCDACNPEVLDSCASGSWCVVSPYFHQSFCGTKCAGTLPCPTGYTCMESAGFPPKHACVPSDFQCPRW